MTKTAEPWGVTDFVGLVAGLAAKERKEHSAAKPQPKMANGKWQMAQVHAHKQFAQAAKILMDSSNEDGE